MKWVILIFAAVISGSHGQDFSKWCPNILNDINTCSTKFLSTLSNMGSLFSNPSSIFSIQTVASSDVISAVCQKSTLQVVEDFYDCAYKKLLACIPKEWHKAFPDLEKTKETLEYMCKNVNDIDITCLSAADRGTKFVGCLQQAMSGDPPDVSTVDGFLSYTCSLYPTTVSCTKSAFGTCPKRTADVMAETMNFQIPVGCDACVSRPCLILTFSFLAKMFLNRMLM